MTARAPMPRETFRASRYASTRCSPRSPGSAGRKARSRDSNRRAARLREANVLGVAAVNESDGIQEANDAFLDILGYTREDLAAGRITWDAIIPRTGPTSTRKPSSNCAVPGGPAV